MPYDLSLLSGSRECMRVVFVAGGKGNVQVDDVGSSFRQGVVCLVDSGVSITISAEPGRCIVLSFDRGLWEHFLLVYPLARGVDAFGLVRMVELDAVAAKAALARLSQLMSETFRGVSYEHQKLLFSLFMLEVLSVKVEPAEAVNVPLALLGEFRELLEANFKVERSTRFYARRLAVSSRRLNELCRIWFAGRDVFDVVMDRICSEAEFMLLGSDVPVKAVAYELGFSSTHHFRVYFKRFRGMTPTELREGAL